MGDSANETASFLKLASYRRCAKRIESEWPDFLKRRAQRLEPHIFQNAPPEKVTEGILEDLFTKVLDWEITGFNPQVSHADVVLSCLGIKHLIIEAKRPGALAWNRRAVTSALDQAAGYAAEQKVERIAVSDGEMLYAADQADGGLRDRVFVSLSEGEPPTDLWWLSVQGIWRRRETAGWAELRLLPEQPLEPSPVSGTGESGQALLHPKYKLPSHCFAYVGDHSKTSTWKLPYLLADGTVDAKRLPKAIQCILTSYRGERVSEIPEGAVPAVLARLARAAAQSGHLPPQATNPAPIYQELVQKLEQLGLKAGKES